MIIHAIKLRIVTEEGEYGFSFSFGRNLTIIRASNSSGKSTLFNCLLYGLGMEEIIGGKGERTLPYAVKDHFDLEGRRLNVVASEVLVELSNTAGKVITLRRAIRDSGKDSSLIEIFFNSHLTKMERLGDAQPTFIHAPGSARKEQGFHRFLELFLGLTLPQVPTTNGNESKLYLQTVFAAIAVEQKRGWTDYIANIPFFGIRDNRTRVVEFLLGLNVFDTNAKRNRLNTESVEIDSDWKREAGEFQREAISKGIIVEGITTRPTALFDSAVIRLKRYTGVTSLPLDEYIVQLRTEFNDLRLRSEQSYQTSGVDAVKEINQTTATLQEFSVLHERSTASLIMQKATLREYEALFKEATEDLERNKTAAKLRSLGANHGIEIASGHCPTCHQIVEDNLLSEAITGPQMDLAVNVRHLESQCRMLERQIIGLKAAIIEGDGRVLELSTRLAKKHDYLNALRGDVSSGAIESKAIIRRQVQIEVEVEGLEALIDKTNEIAGRLLNIANRLATNQAARKGLPKNTYTENDILKTTIFQKQFRANAGSFGYESAPISEVEISPDTFVPCLAQLELREIRTDIKSDSSASDFVRLIWSYLLALYQTSSHPNARGNHPGIMLFDEPGQHSMAADSQHALLLHLANHFELQSIVAASFDEMESVFLQATEGVTHKLIQWDGKLIRAL